MQVENFTSAVLPLWCEKHLILVQRSRSVPSHKGQVAFFGGHRENDESVLECVKREFEEESGVDSSFLKDLEVFGDFKMGPAKTIAIVEGSLDMSAIEFSNRLQTHREWDLCFGVPLTELCLVQNWMVAEKTESEVHFPFYGLHLPPCSQVQIKGELRDQVLWGASAHILLRILESRGLLSQ